MNAIVAGMDGDEAFKSKSSDDGCPEFDFLLADKEKGKLAGEIGGLGSNLPDALKIGDLLVEIKVRESRGPEHPNTPNVEVFEPGTKFALILVTHEIWATRNAKISQNVSSILDKANKRIRRSKARNE